MQTYCRRMKGMRQNGSQKTAEDPIQESTKHFII
jgi:hypothetical protein